MRNMFWIGVVLATSIVSPAFAALAPADGAREVLPLSVDAALATGGTVIFADPFILPPARSGNWDIYRARGDLDNEGAHATSRGELVLTGQAFNLGVAAFANAALTSTRWLASFTYALGPGTAPPADGFVFLFYKDEAPYQVLGPGFGNAIGFNANRFLDFTGPAIQGYGIEFDSWPTDLPAVGPHIALVEDTWSNHLTSVAAAPLVTTGTHLANVLYLDGRVVVAVDGRIQLDHTIGAPDTRFSGVGFSAGSGGLHNRHAVDNVVLVAL